MQISRTLLLATAFLFCSVLIAQGDVYEVTMSGFTFVPDLISIAPGDSVHWTNTTQNVHTVTSGENCTPDGQFDSGSLSADDDFGLRFDSVGDYAYFCIPHCSGGMTGMVEVAIDTSTDELTWGRIRSLYR